METYQELREALDAALSGKRFHTRLLTHERRKNKVLLAAVYKALEKDDTNEDLRTAVDYILEEQYLKGSEFLKEKEKYIDVKVREDVIKRRGLTYHPQYRGVSQ